MTQDRLSSCCKSLDSFPEQESRWVIPGWLPEEQITLLAADGGTGKTSIWVNILAALSSGRSCVLDPEETGIRYLSQKKNSCDEQQQTLLFSIDGVGQVQYEGESEKRDREYMAAYGASFPRPKRGECRDWLLEKLRSEGTVSLERLERDALEAGYSQMTYRRAKDELVKQEHLARTWSTGFGNQKAWHIALLSPSNRGT